MEEQETIMISNESITSPSQIQHNSTTNILPTEKPNLSTTNETPLPSIQHKGDTQVNTIVSSHTDSDGDKQHKKNYRNIL